MKKILAILLILGMTLSVAGCGSSPQTPVADPTPSPFPDVTTEPVSPPPEMPETRIVKGDDGTEVEIPYTVTKAAPLIGAFAQMTEMLTAGGGKIVAAATNNVSDYFKKVFPDYVQSNPNNYNSSSVEDLIAAGAQVCYGPSSLLSADQLAQLRAAGIAYVPINNIATVEGMSNAFLIIGEILGDFEYARAQEFVTYYQGNINLGKERTAGMAEKVTFLSLFY